MRRRDGSKMASPSEVSFPPSRACLWDTTAVGETVSMHLTTAGWLQLRINTATIKLAMRHASLQSPWKQEAFLMATPIINKNDTVVLEINRFDPGKWVEPDRLSPTTLLPEDVPIHCRLLKDVKMTDGYLTYNMITLQESFKDIYQTLSSSSVHHYYQLLSLRIIIFIHQNSIQIICGCVLPSSSIIATPIRSIPLLSTLLSSNLTGVLPISLLQGRVRSGFLTMNETRKLVPLLDTDSHAHTVPLVGIWVSDVALTHPVVWSTALCFFHSSSLHKVRHQGSFLLLLTRRHDYQVWQWSPEPLQWAWHVTSTEDIELLEEYQSAYMMPVMEGVAGHTLLNSASCQWQRKGNHDESLPLPQFHLTPNGPPTSVQRDSDLSCVSIFSQHEEEKRVEADDSQQKLVSDLYEQTQKLFNDSSHEHIPPFSSATPSASMTAPTVTMTTASVLSPSPTVTHSVMPTKSTVTIATNTGRSLLFNDTSTCNRSVQASCHDDDYFAVSMTTHMSSDFGSSLSPPPTLRTLSDTVSMATETGRSNRMMSLGSLSDGMSSCCHDDSECIAIVNEAKRRIQCLLDASPPPLLPSLSERNDNEYSLLPYPRIRSPTNSSYIASSNTTIDDQWNMADAISQRYLSNILPPCPLPLSSSSPSTPSASVLNHEFSLDTKQYLNKHGLMETREEEEGGEESQYIPNVLTDIPRIKHSY